MQRAIREFLKVRTSYDVLPLSFRLIVLDNDLLIKKSLNIFIQNGAAAQRTPRLRWAENITILTKCLQELSRHHSGTPGIQPSQVF